MEVPASEDEFLADFLASWVDCYDERAQAGEPEPRALPSAVFSAGAGSAAVLWGDASSEGEGDAAADRPKALMDEDEGSAGAQKDAQKRAKGRKKGEEKAGKRRNDPNKARNERTRALRALKSEVTELSAQLGALQALTARNDEVVKARNVVRKPEATELVGAPRLWESICRNQLARRVRSERENVRLKRALEGQLQIAHTLERVLKRPALGQVRNVIQSQTSFATIDTSTTRTRSTDSLRPLPSACTRCHPTLMWTQESSICLCRKLMPPTTKLTVFSLSMGSTAQPISPFADPRCAVASMGNMSTCFLQLCSHSLLKRLQRLFGGSTVDHRSIVARSTIKPQRWV